MMSPEENAIRGAGETGQSLVDQPVAGMEQAPESMPDAAPTPSATEPSRSLHSGETLFQSLLSIIVIVLFVITFIVQAFQIPSGSMERTLLIGDYLLVDKIHFGQGGMSTWLLPYRPLQRGDIIVFHYPVDPSQHFVKRVIGLPGDHILMRNKTVFVNDMALAEPYTIHEFDRDSYRDNFPDARDLTGQVDPKWRTELPRHLQDGEMVVPKDEYFVMGDNRDRSLDSRYWGFVPRDNIVGRPLVIYLSMRQRQDDPSGDNDKLFTSGHLLTHVWQFARWDRMFHLVR